MHQHDDFLKITEQHAAYLQRVALRLSGDLEVARDLVQETLVRALLCFDRFAPGTNVRGWMVTILSRLYLDMRKHARVVSRAEGELRALAPVESEVDVPAISDDKLWAAVNALAPDLRIVVERCYLQHRSYKALAEELGVPIGTIGSRLRRAREQLKALLEASQTE